MEDEKRRAAILFGDKFNQSQQQVQVQQAPPVAVQLPVVVEPVKEVIKDNTRDIVREEIRAAMRVEDEVVETPLSTRYFGAMVGIGDYPDVGNVRANYSFGAQFGTKYDTGFTVEGTFQISNYNVDSPCCVPMPTVPQSVEVNQYAGAIAGKYEFLGGMFRPIVGGLMQYSYRTFAWDNFYGSGGGGYGAQGSTTASSQAIDVGTVVGTDMVFSPQFTVGIDFRYLWNLASKVDTNGAYWMSGPQYGTPIEKLSYYVLSVVGRVTF
jgi:hypothetical protein